MKFKITYHRPSRQELKGFSPSEFKTLLKRRGYKVRRDFFCDCIAYRNGRMYRFRYWSTERGFEVDVSCPLAEFDRWANSIDQVLTFEEWLGDKV